MSAALVALRCRTSDRTAGGARGAEALAAALGERLGIEPRLVGEPGEPRAARWEEDLRDSRGCLLEAGGQVEDALAAGRRPVLLASDCSICLTTLPAVLRHRPEARIVWLDAHGDFNTPQTTPSGFLGGMCLAGACGRWDAGLGAAVDPARVTLIGARDLDPGEERELAASGAARVATAFEARARVEELRGAPVYVHLDLDVLDPSAFPAQFPAPGGLFPDELTDLTFRVAQAARVVGVEVTAFEAPAGAAERDRLAALAAEAIAPLAGGAEGAR